MRQHLAFFIAIATLALVAFGAGPLAATGATLPPTDASAIVKETLGQGATAVAPGRDLLLQQRTFAPGADSGAHPAPGPTVLYVNAGAVEFAIDKGAAEVTRLGNTAHEEIAAGDRVALSQGDAVFYDAGVVHDVANPGAVPAVTLEARLNPEEAMPATPAP